METWQLLAIGGSFLAAATVKGVLGIGLPLVAVPLIASITEPIVAVSLMTIPVLTANGWQALQGGYFTKILRRFWPQFTALIGATLIGAQFLATADQRLLSLGLGIMVIIFVTLHTFSLRLSVSACHERQIGITIGLIAGLVGGVTGIYGPVLFIYLVALNMSKNMFVSTIALFFLAGSIPLYGTLAINGHIGSEQLIASAILGAAPVCLGLVLGSRLRNRLPQKLFERFLLVIITVIGMSLIVRNLS
ncbi:MAG: sulfite exporter TauE/SafE family protein [Desulfopila sp.]|nr:sulfite exporter TauE/SafE family protein [Desulfopila sp.]